MAYARTLAAEGVDICLNGFGKPDDIEAERTKIEAEFGRWRLDGCIKSRQCSRSRIKATREPLHGYRRQR